MISFPKGLHETHKHENISTFDNVKSESEKKSTKLHSAVVHDNIVNYKNQLTIPKQIFINGKSINIGMLKGSISPHKKKQLFDAIAASVDASLNKRADAMLTYDIFLKNSKGQDENISVSFKVDEYDNMTEIIFVNHDNQQGSFRVEFDHSSQVRELSLRLNQYVSEILSLPDGAISDGTHAPRHPDGERYQVMTYIKPGEKSLKVFGFMGQGKNNFIVYDSKNHKPVGLLKVVIARNNDKDINSVLVDPSEARLRGGMRHFKQKAEGVKTSRSSPTGFKLRNGQPCDRHGNPIGGASTIATSSSAATQAEAGSAAPIAIQHIRLPLSQRPYSAYAAQVRTALHGQDNIKFDVHTEIYQSKGTQPIPVISALDSVIVSLDNNNTDEVRLKAFLQYLKSQAIAGYPISLPDYYHCTKEQGFEEILSSSNPQVKVQTPRTGTGAQGAWLSTKPEISAYGPFIFGFNHHLDLLHSTTHPSQGKLRVKNVGDDFHIAIQESISLTGKNAYNSAENPLSIVGVPAELLPEYRGLVANLGGQLSFIRENDTIDIALFSTDTVQKFATLLRGQEWPKYPKIWD